MEDKKESVLQIIFCILFNLFLILYAIYHIINGNYGLLSYKNINNFLEKQKLILNKSKIDLKRKQNKIYRLRSNNLDLDLFEEEIKKNVGIIDNKEIIFFTDDIIKK